MLEITMFSSADKVKGQGVGSAYLELLSLLDKYHADKIKVNINRYSKTDISHYHTINFPFYLTTFFKKRYGRRIGYVHFLPETLEGSIKLPKPIQWIFNKYVVSFYKRMDQIVVVNPSFIPKLEALGLKNNIAYIPNFVSKAQFHELSASEKSAFRAEKEIPADQFVVFGAGQIQERKGIFDFIQLAEELPDIQFIWAGGFSFGKITDGYERYKKILDNPPANVYFPGIIDRDEIMKYYNIANIFLLPSYNELFPMCILEAFNCRTPILLRDLPLYESIITGYYEAASDVTEMKQKIIELKENPAFYEALKEKSAAGGAYYSEERLAKIWLDFYTEQSEKR
ncbi:glycosyltransferase family 4 protein [Isobaculum melis]|uniref:1,2-diacylglycerol-3-alpha-glucose alpha-1,2-galactosyltransferase n=1 Tax=Isobaculum melis TaxID=142588 RepID=A0A1H9T9Q8_9LACT|nr:glycosyltransferase family 4 protein [Isobaculum melis]SER93363.1 1,2-diacylglycerol-3-alpha-glucose alpha-1,2-galactosyltransferase [Isobaculum melis]